MGVALIEQFGALLAMSLYLVAMQHILMTSILSKPQDSWINRIKNWWLDEQLREERRKFRAWTSKESATEPSPES